MTNFFNENSQIKSLFSEDSLKSALYIVATPIGNLSDITIRALEILNKCDVILCEDSRITARLLEKFGLKDKKLFVYNDHSNDHDRVKIFNLLESGKSVALVSDAGTPLISDPGHKLIEFLQIRNQKIIPIPGASSVITALCASGLACDNFLFLGFAPNTKIQRQNFLKNSPTNYSAVFFESPNRLIACLEDILEILGERKIAVARELTKIHEEIISDKISAVLKFYRENPDKIRGEIVIIIEKLDRKEKALNREELIAEIKKALQAGMSIKEASQQISEIYDLNKKEVYQIALEIAKK